MILPNPDKFYSKNNYSKYGEKFCKYYQTIHNENK